MRPSTAAFLIATGVVVTVGAIEIPPWHAPVSGRQLGPDAISMVQFAETSPWHVTPAPASADPAATPGGPAATARYTNVSVLTDVSADEFMRLQQAMTHWVSPTQGCGFCHMGDDYASDAKPTKAVAREMLRMTRWLNTTWASHVGPGGVTCFSCHRGEPVPPETWFPSRPKSVNAGIAQSENWDEAADTVRKFFPDNGWALYLLHDEPIRAESATALRGNTVGSQVEVKRVYEMMMQMSDGIGVNCTYCHNSRSFSDWTLSPPARWTAHDAIKMTRAINVDFLLGIHDVLPQTRDLAKQNDLVMPPRMRMPQDGAGLAVCATCHYGHPKPDVGAATVQNYGALASPVNAQPTSARPLSPPVNEH